MDPITCFLIEDTGRDRVSLRRFAHATPEIPRPCPISGYHTALRTVAEEPGGGVSREIAADDDGIYLRDDPRWPKACACGYEFTDEDHWQVFRESLYRGVHPQRGEVVVTLDEAPAGAIWRAPWYEVAESWRGADGRSYVCQTPAGPWHIDGQGRDNCRWERTGEPPRFTVRPSILFTRPDGTQGFHAFLTGGVLEPC